MSLDGPALCIKIIGQGDSWVPLSRVSRITLSTRVKIETQVFIACAERGITMLIHDRKNRIFARVIGPGSDRSGLRQRAMDLTERPDWQQLYADWRSALGRRIALTVTRRMNFPPAMSAHPRRLRRWINQYAERLVGTETAACTRRIYNRHCISWMQQHLHDMGLDAESELWLAGRPDLIADFGRFLALRMEPIRLGWLRAVAGKRGARNPLCQEEIVCKIESQRPRMERFGADIVNRFYVWLVEME